MERISDNSISQPSFTLSAAEDDLGTHSRLNESNPRNIVENIMATSKLPPIVPIDWVFYAIHCTAMVSLAISIVCSVTVLNLHSRTHAHSFWKRKLGERLYVYQAWTDLVFSISHMCDHIIALTSLGDPNRILCTIFAFSLFETIMAQNMVVLLSALSLFLLVRFNYKLPFGPHDVGLLGTAYGGPALFAVIFTVLGYFGSSGYWCLTDRRNPDAWTLHKVLGMLQIAIVGVEICMYGSVWASITRSQRRLNNFSDCDKKNSVPVSPTQSNAPTEKYRYRRTAKVLTLFVVAFLFQWWPTIVIAIWSMISFVQPPFYIAGVVFVNAGGVFNLFVFFIIRKTYHPQVEDSSKGTISLSS